MTLYFDARWFCLRELRQRATFIYQDVDILARRYHWSETEILALPADRGVRRSGFRTESMFGTSMAPLRLSGPRHDIGVAPRTEEGAMLSYSEACFRYQSTWHFESALDNTIKFSEMGL